MGWDRRLISDSPYQAGEPILTPRGGLVAGMLGGLLMLGLLLVFQSLSGFALARLLIAWGDIAIPGSSQQSNEVLLAIGLAVHVTMASLLGLLYAVCQQRIPAKSLIAVGVFYGFVLWIVGSLILGGLFGATLRMTVRSWPWFAACLLYGLWLATSTLWVESRRPADATSATPVD